MKNLLILVLLNLVFLGNNFAQRRDNDGELKRLSKEAEKNRVRTPPGWYHEAIPHSRFRGFLSKFNLEVTTGLNTALYSHKVVGYGVYSGSLGTRIFSPTSYDPVSGNISESLSQWFNTTLTTGAFTSAEPDFVVIPDSDLKFRNKSLGIPLNAALYFKIYRFRLGGGYTFEPQFLTSGFRPSSYKSDIETWKPGVSVLFVKKYYGMLGGEFYRYQDFLFSADLRVGGWSPGKKIQYSSKSWMFNLGTGVEWQKSEYFRPYLRAGFEYKNFIIPSPIGTEFKHNANEITVNFGVILQMPSMPKCFIKNCHIQMNHQHGDREYRSRVHPVWKKQNPNYGENYPRLLKYKRKNKGKLNPY